MRNIILTSLAAVCLAGCQTTSEASSSFSTYKPYATTSWYHHGTRTANGERFNPNGDTVAHRTLPFGTRLRLTNLDNGKIAYVRVNDRGPFIPGTELDVARGVAERLGFKQKGKTKLRIEIQR
jgi:rare lipoprotein A